MNRSTRLVKIQVPSGDIYGDLVIPQNREMYGICIFAHGSGSSRFSPRNQYVANILHEHGMGTLLMDLLTKEEEMEDALTARIRFDIPLLTQRVISAIDYLKQDKFVGNAKFCTFGASTGAAVFTHKAALWSAEYRPQDVHCVVSRGGRPDLVPKDSLKKIYVPTLLLVGGYDHEVIEMNIAACDALGSTEKELRIVPGATHLFEEPDLAAQHAARFLKHHLSAGREE